MEPYEPTLTPSTTNRPIFEPQFDPKSAATTEGQPEKAGLAFFRADSPALKELLVPAENPSTWVNDTKLRKLYLQAAAQQWFAPQKIHFEKDVEFDEASRRVWVRLMTIFYTLEKLGLNVISNMLPKAVARLKSDEVAYYLSAQLFDESRHVFAVENYLKKLGSTPKYQWSYHVLSKASSQGFYRVENWLFSTLFSENFASCFLRHAKNSNLDPLGQEMCRNLLIDESRHLHFLHIVLPDIMDHLSLFGRSYVKMSQSFIMGFTEKMSKTLDKDAAIVGLDRRKLLEEVFENVEKAYEGFGVTRSFLAFPKISAVN